MSFSQNSYPKKILWESDTVLAISKEQLIKINRSLNNYNHLIKVNRNLRMSLEVSDSLCFYWRNIVLKQDSIYSMEAQKFKQVIEMNKNFQDALRKEKLKRRNIIIGTGIGGTFLGAFLGILLKG